MKNYEHSGTKNRYLNEEEFKSLRLTVDEIHSVDNFRNLNDSEIEDLSEFVFSISYVLIKAFKDGPTGLLQEFCS